MKMVLGAIAIAAGALAATAAPAETAVDEQRERLASLWGQDKAVTASRVIASQATLAAADELRSGHATGTWVENFQGGRVHPPAGH